VGEIDGLETGDRESDPLSTYSLVNDKARRPLRGVEQSSPL
jgi:hypothetical protein